MSAPECAKSSITSGGLICFFFFFFWVVLLNLIFLLYSPVGWVDSHQMIVLCEAYLVFIQYNSIFEVKKEKE